MAVCWGLDTHPSSGQWLGQASPPKGETFKAISSGPLFTCALRQSGTPLCWGEGYETPLPEHTAYESITDERFTDIASGLRPTPAPCAPTALPCVGIPRTTPTPHGRLLPPEGARFNTITAGVNHTCGLRADGSAACWGENRNGDAFPPGSEALVAISAGSADTCGLRVDGTWGCWGSVSRTSGGHYLPAPAPGERLTSITNGSYHMCGLREDGSPVCWGSNREGQASPPQGEVLTELSGGSRHTCGLRQDQTAVCWGATDAELNFGQASPPQGERFVSISSGSYHTCALREDGTPVCWGAQVGDTFSRFGQIGFGQSEPPMDERFSSVSSGGDHTCALRVDGTPVCWGKDYSEAN